MSYIIKEYEDSSTLLQLKIAKMEFLPEGGTQIRNSHISVPGLTTIHTFEDFSALDWRFWIDLEFIPEVSLGLDWDVMSAVSYFGVFSCNPSIPNKIQFQHGLDTFIQSGTTGRLSWGDSIADGVVDGNIFSAMIKYAGGNYWSSGDIWTATLIVRAHLRG
jgi:hypothetical protein